MDSIMSMAGLKADLTKISDKIVIARENLAWNEAQLSPEDFAQTYPHTKQEMLAIYDDNAQYIEWVMGACRTYTDHLNEPENKVFFNMAEIKANLKMLRKAYKVYSKKN